MLFIHIIVTTYNCSLWRPQFHTTIPLCAILYYSHCVLQERHCVRHDRLVNYNCLLHFFIYFVSLKIQADESSALLTAAAAAAADTLRILSFLQSEPF